MSARHPTWPAERFYWAVLDAGVLPGRRPAGEQLGFLLEPLVPQRLEQLHCVYHPLGGRRYLACAAPRVALQGLPEEAVALSPAGLPDFVEPDVDPAAINLLSGAFTPRAVRRQERRAQGLAAAFTVLVALALALGLERRVRAAGRESEGLAAAVEAAYASVLGDAATASGVPSSALLEAEWRSLAATRGGRQGVPTESDAAVSLSRLLARWPEGGALEPESLHVNPDSIHIRGQAADNQAVMRLGEALGELEGWEAGTPSLRRAGTKWSVDLVLRRAAAGGGAP